MSRFARVPYELYKDARLTAHLRDLLVLMLSYADESGHCWPSQGKLACDLRVDRTTVNSRIAKLKKLGYLRQEHRTGSSKYWITIGHQDVLPANTGCASGAHPVCVPSTQNKTTEQTNEHNNKGEKHRLPEGWLPPSEILDWARQKFPQMDVETEAERFRLHWLQSEKPSALKVRWDLALKEWLINAATRFGAAELGKFQSYGEVSQRSFNGRGTGAGPRRETGEEARRRLARLASENANELFRMPIIEVVG